MIGGMKMITSLIYIFYIYIFYIYKLPRRMGVHERKFLAGKKTLKAN